MVGSTSSHGRGWPHLANGDRAWRAISRISRQAHLIQRALDDLDAEEEMAGADLAVIARERETLGRLLVQIEDRLTAAA